MSFITIGLAVAGLAAMVIPIVIHLLSRERYQVVQWAAMQFLIEAYRRNKRRLRIEQIILVALRCLILLLLGIALAQPLLNSKNILGNSGPKTVHLVMDDGLISGLTDEQGQTALDKQRIIAQEIIGSLNTDDLISVTTTAQPAQAAVAPATTNHMGVNDLLIAMDPSSSISDIPTALRLVEEQVEQLQDQSQRHVVYLLSEFRQGATSLDEPINKMSLSDKYGVELLAMTPSSDPISNVQVVSITPIRHMVMPEYGDRNTQVTITLRREGGNFPPEDTTLQVVTDRGQEATEVTVSWKAGQQELLVELMLDLSNISSTDIELQASIEHDPLEVDNHQFTSLRSVETIRVAIIDRQLQTSRPSVDEMQPGHWINLALLPENKSPIEVSYIEPTSLDSGQLYGIDVAFVVRPDLLTQEAITTVKNYVQQGGFIIISPPPNIDSHAWATPLLSALSLPWVVELETNKHESSVALSTEQPPSSLLGLLGPEMESLSRPVLFSKTINVQIPNGSQDAVLVFEDGQPALLVGQTISDEDLLFGESVKPEEQIQTNNTLTARRGIVVLMSTALDLEWTNLPSKPLLVPLLHETIRQGLGLIRSQQNALVGQRPVLWPGATEIELANGSRVTAAQNGRVNQPISTPGLWRVQDNQGTDLGVLAININPLGGRTGVNAPEAVQSWLDRGTSEKTKWSFIDAGDPTAALSDIPNKAPIGRMILFIVLGLLVLETLLSRRFSHAHRTTQGGQNNISLDEHINQVIGGGRA